LFSIVANPQTFHSIYKAVLDYQGLMSHWGR